MQYSAGVVDGLCATCVVYLGPVPCHYLLSSYHNPTSSVFAAARFVYSSFCLFLAPSESELRRERRGKKQRSAEGGGLWGEAGGAVDERTGKGYGCGCGRRGARRGEANSWCKVVWSYGL